MTEALLGTLLRQAALFSLAVLLVAALRPPLKRASAGALYAAWLLVPALLLTPALPRPATEPWRAVLAAANAALPAATLSPPAAPASAVPVWPALCLGAWLGGAALVLLVQARRQWRVARLGAQLPAGCSPALVGLLHPHVALPADFDQRFAPAQRTLILAHEEVHRQRRDNLWNLLACVLVALHWWNPLAWWAARRFRADQELACDAAVLAAHPSARTAYAQALLAAHDLHHLGAPLASRWGTAHPLVERIAMLNHARSVSRRRATALGLALAGMTGLGYAAQAAAPADAAATDPQKVEIRLALTSAGSTSTPRLIAALGATARIEWGNAPDQTWRLDLTVTRTADGQLQVVTLPSFAGRSLAAHTGVLASGERFEQRLGGADGVPTLAVSRVVNLLPADFRMPTPTAAAKPAAS